MQTLHMPLILERLSPQARSWMIAKAAQDRVDPQTVAYDAIEEKAERDGFSPPPKAPAGKTTSHPHAA